jgi:hypothetical protein
LFMVVSLYVFGELVDGAILGKRRGRRMPNATKRTVHGLECTLAGQAARTSCCLHDYPERPDCTRIVRFLPW